MSSVIRSLAVLIVSLLISRTLADKYIDQLYENLMYSYNKNVRPVLNATDVLQVKFGASLYRLIDVDEVNQVLTTNLWLEMQWIDHKLKWRPEEWGNIRKIRIPSAEIWIPDIILYNNADGEPDITIMTPAVVYYTGQVIWMPPSIYKSLCPIDIEYFPYDEQECHLKFGGWTNNGIYMDMIQIPPNPDDKIETKIDEDGNQFQFLERGMGLAFFQESAEWDLMTATSGRYEQVYPGCCGQQFYIDIKFFITLRRKALFFTVNLVIPCILIANLTTAVFVIPGREHKLTFSISILVALTVFYLVLIELIPPTSLVIPLIGKYLLFTMAIVSISIIVSVIIVNIQRRKGATHPMPSLTKKIFIKFLPPVLGIKIPDDIDDDSLTSSISDVGELSISGLGSRRASRVDSRRTSALSSRRASPYFLSVAQYVNAQMRLTQLAQLRGMHPDVIRRMIDNVSFIADHFRALEREDAVSKNWQLMAAVLNRLFLILFLILNVIVTVMIVVQSRKSFDSRVPLARTAASKPLSGDTLSWVNMTA